MKLVDPGGVISESLVGRAIGRGCDKATSLIREKWREDLCREDLEEISIQILLRDRIVCEVLNKEGLSAVKRMPFISSQYADETKRNETK